MEMEVSRDESRPSPQRHSNINWWPGDFIEKFGSVSLDSKEEILSHKESMGNNAYAHYSYQMASQILWSTGMLSEPIPDGFYSVIPEKRLKDLFDYIPTLEELAALELEGLQADIILVYAEKDKKLSMLKQLIVPLVKGLSSNPAAMIKKIAGLIGRGERFETLIGSLSVSCCHWITKEDSRPVNLLWCLISINDQIWT